ncbi:ExbD/TolR family protein [Roseibium limicola]|uniref:Biopolymer transporter ExbD n=1 Tax=Roseibium limicola TaxID=2816037 RepID=A0A939J6Z0_9HYPH|nr:biopolymer transporter ExbD [Roseibium limicola]MBO0345607.1 biopolymer transporter ExbD [Roseibium limicola]
MRMKRPVRREPPENTIPLINVVFLMLIFFLFAGSVARDDARQVEPPEDISEDENIRSTGAMILTFDGLLLSQDQETTVADFVAAHAVSDLADEPLKIAADGNLPADRLEEVLAQLRDIERTDVVLITRKGKP